MPIDLVDPRDEDLRELLECALAADTMVSLTGGYNACGGVSVSVY